MSDAKIEIMASYRQGFTFIRAVCLGSVIVTGLAVPALITVNTDAF